jgi:hypothetical protein
MGRIAPRETAAGWFCTLLRAQMQMISRGRRRHEFHPIKFERSNDPALTKEREPYEGAAKFEVIQTKHTGTGRLDFGQTGLLGTWALDGWDRLTS